MPKKVIIDDDGLLVTTMSGPWALADGRLKCALVIKVRGKCRKAIRRDVVLARTREALDQAVQDRLMELKIKSYPVLIEMIQLGEIGQLRLDDYMTMRGSLIARRGKWAGRTTERSDQWNNKLVLEFGRLDLLSVSESDLVEAMERVYHRRRKKSGYSDGEKEAWIILDDLMRCAVDVDVL